MGILLTFCHLFNCKIGLQMACKQLAAVGILFLLAVHVFKTIRRNEDWRTEYTLYNSALSVNQRNAKLFNNMGRVLESLDKHEDALNYYNDAIRIQGDDVRGYLNLGRVYTHLRRYEEAEDTYLKASYLKFFCIYSNQKIHKLAKSLFLDREESREREVRVHPNHLQLFLNLAFLISRNDSRLEEADALYREAITLRSDFTNAYLNRGDVLLKMNRTKEAEAMYQRALEFDDSNPDLYFNLGIVLMDQGRHMEALELFNKALYIEPDHEKSLEFSAVLIHESGMSRHQNLARDRLERIVDRGKETDRVYVRLGLMALDSKDFVNAERCFKKALLPNFYHLPMSLPKQKKPDSREALFNLALLLSEQHRHKEALSFLEQLLRHHPSHINGLILLADINVNHLKNLDVAEEGQNVDCLKMLQKSLEDRPRQPKSSPQSLRLALRTTRLRDGRAMPVPHPVPSPHSTLHPAAPAGGQEHPEARLGGHCLQPHGRIIPPCQLTNPLWLLLPRAFHERSYFLPSSELFFFFKKQLKIRPLRRICGQNNLFSDPVFPKKSQALYLRLNKGFLS
ncbi:protein O-mannosyl-transferase Tmtc3 [Caerostris darwini]|uniref:Protein O-mannosyl-transferase Tmtc3 n=1 Tax=Caerostris darwini TaxID=1538125 RepID=A0AAV4REL2_9ARAC|nr:protein O-mannosyl-transferase Tmtc3 [Caerostris darwini]